MDAYSRLNRTLEALGDATVLPNGLRGTIFATIDNLISAGAPTEHIHAAGNLSVAVQKLEWAMFKRDEEHIADAWRHLREMSDHWLSSTARIN